MSERGEMKEMHVSEAKTFRIQRMPEHLVVIMEDSKKKKKKQIEKSYILQILDFIWTQHTSGVQT